MNLQLLKLAVDKVSLEIGMQRDPTAAVDALRELIETDDEHKRRMVAEQSTREHLQRARVTEHLQVVGVVFVAGSTVVGWSIGYGWAYFGGSLAIAAVFSTLRLVT